MSTGSLALDSTFGVAGTLSIPSSSQNSQANAVALQINEQAKGQINGQIIVGGTTAASNSTSFALTSLTSGPVTPQVTITMANDIATPLRGTRNQELESHVFVSGKAPAFSIINIKVNGTLKPTSAVFATADGSYLTSQNIVVPPGRNIISVVANYPGGQNQQNSNTTAVVKPIGHAE